MRFVIFSSFILSLSAYVFAVNALAPSVQPVTIDVNAQPSSQSSSTYRIVNPFGSELTYKFVPQIFVPTNTGTNTQLNIASQQDAPNWLSISTPSIVIPPLSYLDVEVILNVPANANPGNYFIYLAFVSEGTKIENGATINSQFGPLMFLRVGNDQPAPELTLTQANSTIVYDSVPKLGFEFNNVGNAHAIPVGVVNVNPVLAIDSGSFKYDFNKAGERVLSGFDRKIDQTTKKLLGIYDVQIVVAYGPSNTVLESTVRMLILPVWVLYILAGVVFVIILLVARRVYLRYSGNKAIAQVF